MNDFASSIAASTSGMKAQATRLRHVSENISNADTPGYRRKSVPFEAHRDSIGGAETVSVGRVRLDRSELEKIFDPTHPLADTSGHYQGSNVNLMLEIADARESQRSYEANLKMFDQVRQMSANLLELLRK